MEEISRRSSRLFAAFLTPDPYAPASEYSGPEEVISEYDSDDLYNGSLDNEYSDEDDEFYYGSSMEEDSSIVTSDNDKDKYWCIMNCLGEVNIIKLFKLT